MSEMKQNQGGNDDDDAPRPRCPSHPGFVHGLCFLCGAKAEEEDAAEGGAPGVAVGGDETTEQGGDGDGEGEDDAYSCPKHPGFVDGLCSQCWAEEEEAAGGGAALPGVAADAVGYEVTDQGGGDGGDDDAEKKDAAGGSASGVTVASIHGKSPVMPTVKAATSASDTATLMREKKLVLILDLDHTLLNSTNVYDVTADEQAHGHTPDTIGDPLINLYRLDSDHLLVKLRPFAGGFLEQARGKFEMHVYTLGNRAYARAAVALLDPDGVYFGGRIVSSDESTRKDTKSLDVIHGADPAMVVILDDTDVVWPEHERNLVLMDRYHYFASTCRKFGYRMPSMAEQGVDERKHDGSLAVVLGVLNRVHQGFFEGNRADVRESIAEVRRQVLPGCTVTFSYLEEWMEDFPEDTLMWRLAEALGAVCEEDADETVTHVVAEDPGTQKAQWARDNNKFLVNLEWVKAASFRWRRQDEQSFPVITRRELNLNVVASRAAFEQISSDSHLTDNLREDVEKGCSPETMKTDEQRSLSPGYENIIGSLCHDGSRLLNIDCTANSEHFHCFTVPEIRHVLMREESTSVNISGLEKLLHASEVFGLICAKLSTSRGWKFGRVRTIESLSKINIKLENLKGNLLPGVTRKSGKDGSKGNTSATAKVLKKVRSISRLASSLKRTRRVQGVVIGSELCKKIRRDVPSYLRNHGPELIEMVNSELNKPVWFYEKETLK